MKKFFYIAFIFLIVTGCLPEDKSSKSDAVLVQIAGREFKVPKGYFDGRSPHGRKTESVVLEYSLPGFEVLPEHPQYRRERQQLIKEGRKRGMLLEAADSRPSLDIAVRNHKRGRNFKKQEELVYGLEKYVHQVPEVLPHQHPISPKDDLLIEIDSDGSAKSYIRCSPPGKVKIPSCRHRFVDNELLFQVHWNLTELSNWREQRDSAIHFINSLEIKTTEKE